MCIAIKIVTLILDIMLKNCIIEIVLIELRCIENNKSNINTKYNGKPKKKKVCLNKYWKDNQKI